MAGLFFAASFTAAAIAGAAASSANAGTDRESAGKSLRAFAFEDSIRMRYPLRIASEGEADTFTKDMPFFSGDYGLFSPGKKYVFTIDRRGDLERGVLIDALHVYEADALASLLERKDADVAPVYTVERTSAVNAPPMQALQWRSESEISFLGTDENGLRQVFLIDIKRGKTKQLTTHPTSILAHKMSNGVLAFLANSKSRVGAEEFEKSRPIGDSSLHQMINPEPWGAEYSQTIEIFVQRVNEKRSRRIPLPKSISFQWLWDLEISPDGERVLFFYPYVDPLPEFAEYPQPNVGTFYSPDMAGEKSTSAKLWFSYRYWSYDVRTGKAEPLLNAPHGDSLVSGNVHDQSVIWISRHEAIIPSLLMPLTGVEGEERKRRAAAPVIAYVDFRNKNVEPILYQPLTPFKGSSAETVAPRIVEMRWDKRRGQLLLKRAPNARAPEQGVFYEAYRKDGGSWVGGDADEAAFNALEQDPTEFVVSIDEGLNTPPTYTVVSLDGSQRTPFRRLNPQLDEIKLARTEKRTWTDRNGLEWKGGLVYPVDYQPGKKYPFILQTHGFFEAEYLIDGFSRTASAFAARSFSARGFFVMQMNDGRGAVTQDTEEGANFTAAYEALIDQLAEEGLIDRRRVGAIGWSRTAFHVMQAAWRNPGLFASVTANDGMQASYMSFLTVVNFGADQIEAFFSTNDEAAPFGEGLDEWRKHSLTFNLDKVTAAVLVEPITFGPLLGMWETYAVLKFLEKPVDLLYHPIGTHALKKPSERYVSQKYNVQWHQFWLTGVEDPDPAFEGQYVRWRKMRDEYCATMKAANKTDPPVYCH